jgi:hypothetical protein
VRVLQTFITVTKYFIIYYLDITIVLLRFLMMILFLIIINKSLYYSIIAITAIIATTLKHNTTLSTTFLLSQKTFFTFTRAVFNARGLILAITIICYVCTIFRNSTHFRSFKLWTICIIIYMKSGELIRISNIINVTNFTCWQNIFLFAYITCY